MVGLCHIPREGCGGLLAECPNDGLYAAKRKRRAGEDSAVCRLQSQVGKMAEKLCGFKNTSHPCVLTPYGSKVVVLYASASKPSETIWNHLKPHHFCQLSLAFPNFPPSRRLVGPVSFACAKPPGWPSCQRRRARCCASARCSWRCWRPRRAPWSQRLGAPKDSGRGWHWEKWCLFWVGIFGVRWSRRWDDSGFDYSIYIYTHMCVCVSMICFSSKHFFIDD